MEVNKFKEQLNHETKEMERIIRAIFLQRRDRKKWS